MLKNLFYIIISFWITACASSAEDSLDKSAAADAVSYTLDKKDFYAPHGPKFDPIDTIYDDGRQIVLLKVHSYSLNDSALVDVQQDTINHRVRIHKQYRHNGQIDFKLIDGDSTWHFYLDKMEFAKVLSEDLVKAGTPEVEIRAIDPRKSKVVLGANFCYPNSDACNDGFALIDYRKRMVKFVAGHGGASCGSGIEVIANSRILTCRGLYDYDGRELMKFEDYIVLAEPVQKECFLLLEARYRKDTLENGLIAYSRDKDLKSYNARLIDKDGNVLQSFPYHAYSDEREYNAPILHHKHKKGLYLFDFENDRYFWLSCGNLKEKKLYTRKSKPTGFTSYKINRAGINKEVVVNTSGTEVYLLET